MGLKITKEDYIEYLKRVLQKLEKEKDYVTELDAVTGDGDHWANMYTGFSKLCEASDELKEENLQGLFQKSGMKLMSGIGGSSGVLYGGAYIGAAKVLAGVEEINLETWHSVMQAMLESIMKRGGAKPGHKTMIDALAPVVDVLEGFAESGKPEEEIIEDVKKAARKGAEDTKAMKAVFGRAVYQADKGEGHLDPGAVTMAYQIEILADMFL